MQDAPGILCDLDFNKTSARTAQQSKKTHDEKCVTLRYVQVFLREKDLVSSSSSNPLEASSSSFPRSTSGAKKRERP